MARKIRPDSKIGNLPVDIKDEVDELLLSGESYRKVKKFLEDYGTSISETSIGQYWTNHLQPAKWARQTKTAAALDKIEDTALDAATLMAIKQQVYEMASRANFDTKSVKTLYELILKTEKLSHDSRKLKLLEQKAAEAKALAQQVIDYTKAKGVSDETIAAAQEKLNIM